MPKGIYIRTKKYKEECKERMKGYKRSASARIKQGITISGKKHWNYKEGLTREQSRIQKQEKLAGRKRPEQCEVCGAMGDICFDHDHKTGEFREWICRRCNLLLGLAKDNSELLNALSEYLKQN